MNVKKFYWKWGLTKESEIWNGRFAMFGFIFLILIELFLKESFLSWLAFNF
jgi:hypothetical protein